MTEHIKAMDAMELDIMIAIEDYNQTGDIAHLVRANHVTHQMDAERRHHDKR